MYGHGQPHSYGKSGAVSIYHNIWAYYPLSGRQRNAYSRRWRHLPMEYWRWGCLYNGEYQRHLCGNGNKLVWWLYGYGQPHGNRIGCYGQHNGIGCYDVLCGRLGNAYSQRRRHLPMEYWQHGNNHCCHFIGQLYGNGNEFGRMHGQRQPHGNG